MSTKILKACRSPLPDDARQEVHRKRQNISREGNPSVILCSVQPFDTPPLLPRGVWSSETPSPNSSFRPSSSSGSFPPLPPSVWTLTSISRQASSSKSLHSNAGSNSALGLENSFTDPLQFLLGNAKTGRNLERSCRRDPKVSGANGRDQETVQLPDNYRTANNMSTVPDTGSESAVRGDSNIPTQRNNQEHRRGRNSKQRVRAPHGSTSIFRNAETHTYQEGLGFEIRPARPPLHWSNLTPLIIPTPRKNHKTRQSRSRHSKHQEHKARESHGRKRKNKSFKKDEFGALGWLLRRLCICGS